MIKKVLTLPLLLSLVLCFCAISVFAEGAKKGDPVSSTEVKETSRKEANRAKPKLKADMDKLVEEAKAGKIAPHQQQFPRTAKNGLSKTTKIVIAASAIGAGVFLIVMFHALSKD